MLNTKCGLQFWKSVAQNWIVSSRKHDKTREGREEAASEKCVCHCVCACEGEAKEGQKKNKL